MIICMVPSGWVRLAIVSWLQVGVGSEGDSAAVLFGGVFMLVGRPAAKLLHRITAVIIKTNAILTVLFCLICNQPTWW